MNTQIKIVSLFSGIGAFEKALRNIGARYNLVAFCELDKYAVKSYCAVHDEPESKNLDDITKVDKTALQKDIDVLTYGFPCQDISLAGKQVGLFDAEGAPTRSGLFFEALGVIEETRPRVAIAENVKNLVSNKFLPQFKIVLASLEAAGYNNYWCVMNAKSYGVPQNRERVIIVSIRKDIDTGSFSFPSPVPLSKHLKDFLLTDVCEGWFLSDRSKNRMVTDKNGQALMYDPSHHKREGRSREYNNIAPTLTARDYKDPRLINQSVLEKLIQNENYEIGTECGGADDRVRKLTPQEYWRLMGFTDEDFKKAESVNSNTQLYKQAGNSIAVPVLEHLFIKLIDCGVIEVITEQGPEDPDEEDWLT